MPLTIVRQDIAKMEVDAVVNPTNTSLLQGGGVSGAIFEAAGASELQEACNLLAPIETGQAVITPGFNLPAKYIIHTVGPVYRGGEEGEALELHLSYLNSLKLAVKHNCESVAFPLISTGLYRYPQAEALQIATETIRNFLGQHDLHVYLVIFDRASFSISERLLQEVEAYISANYVVESKPEFKPKSLYSLSLPRGSVTLAELEPLEKRVENLDEPFSQFLLSLIDAKGLTDVEVYKRANLDRKLFSKIRTIKGYRPSKRTVIALAIGLELSMEETNELLQRAGFALSTNQVFDVIIEYFISLGKYDIHEINHALFAYDQPLLGA